MPDLTPFLAVRNHWDPRSMDHPWSAYAEEADKALADQITRRGPGKGFHECMNFAFEDPDNRPTLHLYLPPTCYPSAGRAILNDLLVFIFTYKTGQQGPFPFHLVALAGHAAFALGAGGEPRLRTGAGSRYGDDMHWVLAADQDDACVLVEPLPAAGLGVPAFRGGKWREGRRYIDDPTHARRILEQVRRTSMEHAVWGSQCLAAARRQLEVAERLLAGYAGYWSGTGSATTPEPPPEPGTATGAAGHLTPDPETGRRAEELVVRLERAELLRQATSMGLTIDADGIKQRVFAWHEFDRPFEDHDIQSFRFGPRAELQPLRLEVKSSRAEDLGTIRISERQLRCARSAGPGGYQHNFVLVRIGADGQPAEDTVRYVDVAELEPHLLPIEWRLDGPRWATAGKK